MTTETVLKSLIETMQVSREVHDRRFDQLGQKIEDLAVQVSHLTTSVDQMSRSVTLMAQSVDRIANSVEGHLQVAQQQSLNIAELTKLVASQSNTVNCLIDRVAA
jgi:methyl-accepting chemotaxis protein